MHLVILHHGLWGNSAHMEPVARHLKEYCSAAPTTTSTTAPTATSTAAPTAGPAGSSADFPHAANGSNEVVVVADGGDSAPSPASVSSDAKTNASAAVPAAAVTISGDLAILNISTSSGTLTYDGIDVCGDRCVETALAYVKEVSGTSNAVDRISLIGYSLGGLIVRYAAGKLFASGLFDTVRPVNFITIATPHLGSYVLAPTTGAHVYNVLQEAALVRVGKQFLLKDSFTDEISVPILLAMSDPALCFYQALAQFKNRALLANMRNDLTVPFATAAIERTDLFAHRNPVQVSPDVYPSIVVPSPTDPPVSDPWTLRQIGFVSLLGALSPVLVALWLALVPLGLTTLSVRARMRTSELVYDSDWLRSAPRLLAPEDPKQESCESVAKLGPDSQHDWMARTLNALGWRKVFVSIKFTNAHAAIVQRRGAPEESKDVLVYLAKEVFLQE
ncbi:putative serine esterase-domain-containing protein [Entophlyctis helioformis]|nr:putative serine esterase-domain-containing protein [Entophlyctis helioformis]